MLDEIDEMELLASVNPEPDATGNPWEPDEWAPAVEISPSDTATSGDRARRRRFALAAAVIAVVVGGAGIAISDVGDGGPSRVGTDGPTPTTSPPAPPVGEEIGVTPDAIELGDGLVAMSITEEDGRRYVLAGRVRNDPDPLFAPEEAVLAAFDDAGRELWRTELDGGPGDVVVTDGDLWVARRVGTLSRIDAADGRVLGDVKVEGMTGFAGAFGSLWVGSIAPSGPGELLRIDSDLSITTIEIPLFDGAGLQLPRAGAGAVWFPLQGRGVAMIDPATNRVTLIPADVIGHAAMFVAFDGDVVYVTDGSRVTSIVDGEVLATVAPGPISYLGPIDGVFGVQLDVDFQASPEFVVLRANDPMVVATRQIAPIPEQAGAGLTELDGDAWLSTGRNGSLRRAELLPLAGGGG
jgi:hypothetical protein